MCSVSKKENTASDYLQLSSVHLKKMMWSKQIEEDLKKKQQLCLHDAENIAMDRKTWKCIMRN